MIAALVLAGPQRETVHARFYTVAGRQAMTISDDHGYQCNMYRDHTPDANASNWHPALWWGTMDRRADDGTDWYRVLPRHVTDDFGTLVPVGCAQ